MTYSITINSMEDAKRINDAAFDFDGKLLVESGLTMIDAKSLLALFGLIGRHDIRLVAPDHTNPSLFLKLLEKIDTYR